MTTKARRTAVVVAAVLACCGLTAPAALAAKHTTKSATATDLTLSYQYVWNSPNPAAPTWCMNEDDIDIRTWTGSLAGSFNPSDQLCDGRVDYSGGLWWNAGGVGIAVDLYGAGTLDDMRITSPLGDSHHAVLMGSSTSRGVTTYHWAACYVPGYSLLTNTGSTPLPGGTWTTTASGNLTSLRLTIDAQMAYVTFQQNHCPPSEQHLY